MASHGYRELGLSVWLRFYMTALAFSAAYYDADVFPNKSLLIFEQMLMLKCCALWKHAPLLTTSTGLDCFRCSCFKEKRVVLGKKLFLCISLLFFLISCKNVPVPLLFYFYYVFCCIIWFWFLIFILHCTSMPPPPRPPVEINLPFLFCHFFLFVRYPSPLFDRPSRFMSRSIDVIALRRFSLSVLISVG